MLHKLGKMVWTTIITSSLSLQVVVVIDTGSDGRWWWVIYGVVAASLRQVEMDNIGGERLWEARCIERGVLLQLVFRSPVTRLEKNRQLNRTLTDEDQKIDEPMRTGTAVRSSV